MRARADQDLREVSVAGAEPVGVRNLNQASVAAHFFRHRYYTVSGSNHRMTVAAGNINAAVERAFPVKWIDAFAERSGHHSLDRPQIRGLSHAHPVGSGRTLYRR